MKVLARGWDLYINTGTGSYNWVPIGGLKSFDFGGSKTDADTTTFADGGNKTHVTASRTKKISVEANYLENQLTGERDAGQEAVELLDTKFGNESLEYFKLVSPFGVEQIFKASANVSGIGGGNDDPTGWKCDLDVSGATTKSPIIATSIVAASANLSLSAGEVSSPVLVTFTPRNTTDKALVYQITTGDTKAAVTPEGRVIGLSVGSAVLTITAVGGETTTVNITVS